MPKLAELDIVLKSSTGQFVAGINAAVKHLRLTDTEAGRTQTTMVRMGAAFKRVGAAAASATKSIASGFANIGKSVAVGTAGIAAAAGLLLYGPLGAAAAKVDDLGKAAKRLGLSIETLSAYRFAAGQAGVEVDSLTKLMGKAAKELAEVASKGGSVLRIGGSKIALRDQLGQLRDIGSLLPEIARGFEGVRSEGEQMRIAEMIFGRGGGTDFLTWLKDSGGFLDDLSSKTARLRQLGGIYNAQQVRDLTAYNDALAEISVAWEGIRVKVMTQLAPALTELAEGFATRLAGVPALTEAMIAAVRKLADGDPQAMEALAALRDSSIAAGKGVISELAAVGATAIADALKIGFSVASPYITDVLRDSVAPLLNAIPGVSIELSKRGQLAAATKRFHGDFSAVNDASRLARIADLQQQISRTNASPMAAMGQGMGGGVSSIAAAQTELRRLVGSRDELREQIGRLTALVDAESVDRAATFARVLQTGFRETGMAADEAGRRIAGLTGKLDDAAQRVMDQFGSNAFVGPPAPAAAEPERAAQGYFPNLVGAFRGIVVVGRRSMAELGASVKSGLEDFKKLANGVDDMREDLAIRSANTSGNSELAERLELMSRFRREREALAESYKRLPPPILANLSAELEQVQRAEMAAYDRTRTDPLRDQAPQASLSAIDGIAQALAKLRDEVSQVATLTGDVTNRAVQGLAGGLTDSIVDATGSVQDFGKAALQVFDDVAKSIAKTILNFYLMQAITGALAGIAPASFGGRPITPADVGPVRRSGSFAMGGAFDRGHQIRRFASGGVVTRPHTFAMRGGLGLMGEAGPEGILPLERIGGKLGVNAAGGGTTVQIIDQRGSGAAAQVSQSRGPDGAKVISVLIRDEVNSLLGSGSLDRSMRQNYGLSRRPTAR